MGRQRGLKILFWMCVAMALVVVGILVYLYTLPTRTGNSLFQAWATLACVSAAAFNLRQARKKGGK